MLVLGIDPGTATTGYGLVDVKDGNMSAKKYGLIETDKNGDPEKRLLNIYKRMLMLIKAEKPDVVAIEMVFFATNAKTAIRVGQAIGVLMLAAAEAKVPLFEYAPGTIKKQVSGNGRSDKKEMQVAVRKHLGSWIREKKGKKTHFDNEADGLAVAMCHLFVNNLVNQADR